ncbi:class I SAM-dependent methyltransferase [Comamonas testosteroni]|uniref:class I SAM-dependent methyltransferase n=1 Tax=Comamonas testosteroni TaxID=285 RepID=UPI0009BBAC64|nr:methyltransferase domain-containing protein [Comamonas testosteroni]
MNNEDYSGKEILVDLEECLSNYNNWTISILTEDIKNLSDKKVLDYGSGTGILSDIFSKRFQTFPIAVEIDPALKKISEEKGFEVFRTIEEIDEKFDFIFSSNVLEHIEDDRATIEKMMEKLSVGGTISLYLPAFDVLWSTMDDKVGHYRRYDKKKLLDLVEGLPVEIVKMKYIDPVGFFITLLYKFIKNNGSADKKYLIFYDIYLVKISKILNSITGRIFGKNILFIFRKI